MLLLSLQGSPLSSLVLKLQLSFEISEYTANVDGLGTLRLLDAIRTCKLEREVKLYQVGLVSLAALLPLWPKRSGID